MKEIKISAETVAAEGMDTAYRFAVVDMYNALGQTEDALTWLWQDLAAQGGN